MNKLLAYLVRANVPAWLIPVGMVVTLLAIAFLMVSLAKHGEHKAQAEVQKLEAKVVPLEASVKQIAYVNAVELPSKKAKDIKVKAITSKAVSEVAKAEDWRARAKEWEQGIDRIRENT